MVVLLGAAVDGAVSPVQLVQTEWNRNVENLEVMFRAFTKAREIRLLNNSPLRSCPTNHFSAILPVHLTAVVVELSVRAAREAGDPPTAGVAVRSSLAVTPVNRHNSSSVMK